MAIISKARAKASLRQIEAGKRSDGMGEFDAKIFAKNETVEIELTSVAQLESLTGKFEFIIK
jgi:hypothetical protein